jgi:choline-glycine betaine transporter
MHNCTQACEDSRTHTICTTAQRHACIMIPVIHSSCSNLNKKEKKEKKKKKKKKKKKQLNKKREHRIKLQKVEEGRKGARSNIMRFDLPFDVK